MRSHIDTYTIRLKWKKEKKNKQYGKKNNNKQTKQKKPFLNKQTKEDITHKCVGIDLKACKYVLKIRIYEYREQKDPHQKKRKKNGTGRKTMRMRQTL